METKPPVAEKNAEAEALDYAEICPEETGCHPHRVLCHVVGGIFIVAFVVTIATATVMLLNS